MLSERIKELSESATIAMSRKSRELQSEGHDVINLSVGEPDFNTPEFIKEAAKTALDQNYTHYTPVPGYLELRKAVCKKLMRDNGLIFSPDQIVVSTGAKQCLANAILSLINPGDEVILPVPYWVSYPVLVKLAGGQPVCIPTSPQMDFKVSTKQLKEAINSRTKMLILNSPCNPSGSVYEKAELEKIAELLELQENVLVLSDEIYEYINFSGEHESIAQFNSIKNRVIVVNGLSKAYAMTGWRIGYMAASSEIANACAKLQGQFTTGASSISQRAAIAALEADPKIIRELRDMIAVFKERRDLVIGLLGKVKGIKVNMPKGTFYVFFDITSYFGKRDGNTEILDSEALCMFLLRKAFVSLVPGAAFGDPNCIRLSYATSNEKLIEGIGRIEKALSSLR